MEETENNILSLIPQRPPFVMIDQLTFSDQATSRSVFRVKSDNIFVVNGQLREPALIENIAQTAAARAGFLAAQSGLPVMIGYIGAIKKLEIFGLPLVNDTLETEITIENQIFNVTIISGRIRCKEKVVAQC